MKEDKITMKWQPIDTFEHKAEADNILLSNRDIPGKFYLCKKDSYIPFKHLMAVGAFTHWLKIENP